MEWWTYFNQIHTDTSISTADKFRYLVQSLESGTEAAEIVSSFPKIPENYQKAISMLKEKYGKKDMLISMYMTDLAELLFNKDKGPLSKFFVSLQTQLQSLESLGVKSEESSQYLVPMIVKSLPKETLTAWFRSPLSKVNGGNLVPSKSKLECMLEFLKDEVESEWKIEQASGEKEKKKGAQRQASQKSPRKEEVATAAGLFASSSPNSACTFCGRGHSGQSCYSAQKMNYKEKGDKLREKKACLVCFKIGHRTSACKTKVQCGICNRRHHSIMCYDHPSNRNMEIGRAARDDQGE